MSVQRVSVSAPFEPNTVFDFQSYWFHRVFVIFKDNDCLKKKKKKSGGFDFVH